MSAREFDVIVVGLGGMGAAIAAQLARRGRRVLGLEQFDIPHDFGSSHGSSRVIRLAYFEDARYVPLVRRAYQLWRELEVAIGERLLVVTGGLDMGPADGAALRGVCEGLTRNEIGFEPLSVADVRQRFPAVQLPDGHAAIYQADTGFVIPERGTIAHAQVAMNHGAELRAREAVDDWRADSGRVEVRTPRGAYRARHLVFAAGPWLGKVLPRLAPVLRIERQVQAWFRPLNPPLFDVGRMPVLIHLLDGDAFYAVPQHARPGVKICRHHGGATVDPDSLDRQPTAADEDVIRAYIRRCLPAADGPVLAMKVCLYTNTPDEHFIIDRHPLHPEVFIAGGFSGHGYKFAPVVGEIVADLIERGRTEHDVGAFGVGRLGVG